MTFSQVISFFQSKENTPCDITERLIENGFHQRKGTGYLLDVKSDDKLPSQWQHLMNYCQGKDINKAYPYTPCGELVFWMAEASNAVDQKELEKLADEIIDSGAINNRRIWNKKITNLCWQNIKKKIENT
ncbi:MAG: hypothetical protein ACOX0K_10890 [Oscillospiraceae bacterium]|jgi:hypothetical protein